MPLYAPPQLNPACQCQGNPMKAFFCPTGHMLECHFPLDCRNAGCGHLIKYEYTPEEAHQAAGEATDLLRSQASQTHEDCEGSGITHIRQKVKGLDLSVEYDLICQCVITRLTSEALPE